MSIFPLYNLPTPSIVSTQSLNSVGGEIVQFQLGFASGAWPSANRAYYVPFSLRANTLVLKMFVANGSTASGNFDVGIYDTTGTKIVSSGSTAQSGTSTLQVVDITDTLLGPGKYYMALAMDGTTGTAQKFTMVAQNNIGTYLQATAFALPATATLGNNNTTYLPMFGFSTVTTV